MTLILRYFTEFGSFRGTLPKMVEDIVAKSSRSLYAVARPSSVCLSVTLVQQNAFVSVGLTLPRPRYGPGLVTCGLVSITVDMRPAAADADVDNVGYS